jgi:hypothetical protein
VTEAPAVIPNLDKARAFIKALTGKAEARIRVRMIHDSDKNGNRSEEAEGTIAELWPAIVEWQRLGFGAFYVLNQTGTRTYRFATDADIEKIHALATDHDDGLPPEAKWHQRPSLIVKTSCVGEIQKGQLLWPVINCPVTRFEEAQKRLAAYYGSDPTICNPSRVLRLPGSLHLKDPSNPQLVTFERLSDKIWLMGKLMRGLPNLGARSPQRPARQRRASDGEPISVDILRDMLGYLNPGCDRGEWFRIIAAIRAAPVPDDEDESDRRELAHEWSEPAHNYDSRGDVDRMFDDMEPPEPGDTDKVYVGTLIAKAREAGYQGPISIAEVERIQKWAEIIGASQGAIQLMPEPLDRTPSPAFAERMKQTVAEERRRGEELAQKWGLR